MKNTQLNVVIPEDLHKKLKILAVSEGKKIKDLIVEFIEEAIKKQK